MRQVGNSRCPDFGNGAVPVKGFCSCGMCRPKVGLKLDRFEPSCCHCRLRLRSSRVHASVRGQRKAANMMLVQCNSDVPVSLACSTWIGNSPERRCPAMVCGANHERGHHRNRVPGGPRRPALRPATVGNAGRQAACGTVISDWKSVPSTHIRRGITAIRRARATMARFAPRRPASCSAHGLSHALRPPIVGKTVHWTVF